MKAYLIKTKEGEQFWTAQMPVEEQLTTEEVIGEADITEDFVVELPDNNKDRNYLILELAQMVRLNNVEEKLEQSKNRKTRKARKSLK
jgi:hypothetical protein